MSYKCIRDIKACEDPEELRIRVIKKWIPHFRKEDLCYLFVDAYGDGIEAITYSAKEEIFDSKIKVMSCYAVSDYASIEARGHMAVTLHKASLRLGELASFIPIKEDNIPTYYYNFASYQILKERLKDHSLLTDYIGRIERISGVLIRQGKNLRKVTILDTNNNIMDITFWNEKINIVSDTDAIGKVMAVTSTIVTIYNDMLQLESTSATTVDINPPLPNLAYYINRFKELDQAAKIPITLTELLSNAEHKMRNPGISKVTITSIETGRPWYYVNCNECNQRAYLQLGTRPKYVCLDHKEEVGVKYMYCVNATIADDTTTAKVVFFDEAMTEMLDITCKDMVLTHRYIDPKTIPDAILKITGISWLLQLTLRKDGTIAAKSAQTQTKINPITPDPKTQARKRYPHELPGKEPATKKTKP